MRLMNLAAFCFAVASAFLLYSLNYETRRLEAHVQSQERAAEKARSDIAVLKAERGHLSRPACSHVKQFAKQAGDMCDPGLWNFFQAGFFVTIFRWWSRRRSHV